MQLPPAKPQTLRGVVGYYVFAMIAFGFGSAVLKQLRGDPLDIAQGIRTGAWFGTLMITWDYFRLAPKDRLAPVHAIGLGLVNLGLVVWALAMRKDPITFEWNTWAPALVLALPLMVLISAAAWQWRRDAQASPRRGDGT